MKLYGYDYSICTCTASIPFNFICIKIKSKYETAAADFFYSPVHKYSTSKSLVKVNFFFVVSKEKETQSSLSFFFFFLSQMEKRLMTQNSRHFTLLWKKNTNSKYGVCIIRVEESVLNASFFFSLNFLSCGIKSPVRRASSICKKFRRK